MRIKRTRLTRLPHVICSEAPKADPCRPATSFADERTINAAAHLGLAHNSAEALADQIKQLLPAEEATAERKQFTKIVDALVASDLEHKYDELEEVMQGEAGVDDHPADEKAKEAEDQEKPAAKAAKKEE